MGHTASRWCCPHRHRSARLLDVETAEATASTSRPGRRSASDGTGASAVAGRDSKKAQASSSAPNLRALDSNTWASKDGRDFQRAAGCSINYRGLLPERFEVDVDNRYVLDKAVFGEGGYGKVFVARDKQYANRCVAVKRVTKTGNVERTQAFHDEIRIMKDLDHPNICKLLETFEKDRHIFFVMEFCPGGELFDRIMKQGNVSESVTIDVITQVGAALCYAHGRSIAHRDIKPENIMFCSKDPDDHQIKVIDWGLSVSFAGGEVMRTAVGSTTYAAPEVLRCRNQTAYTQACDVWSLGVVAYVMLCGKPPFWGSNVQHLRRAEEEKYPLDGELWDNKITVSAKDFIRALLKADPKTRLTTQQVVSHPWLMSRRTPQSSNVEETTEILGNLRKFSNNRKFIAFCTTAVARQLDHTSLREVHQVFQDMDTDMDGVLSFQEISDGFKLIFGEDSEEYQHVAETFRGLDLDGSGSIDYTEFCAAGLGHHAMDKDEAVWAAFKIFDLDNNGRLSRAEIQEVIMNVDLQRVWSQDVVTETVTRVLARFDKDGDGEINFDEWMVIMRDAWRNKHVFTFSPKTMTTASMGGSEVDPEDLIRALSDTSPGQAYHVLLDSFGLADRSP